jgi:predicted ATPase
MLIDAIVWRGFRTMPKPGRAIKKDQIRIGGSALQWPIEALFAELTSGCGLRSFRYRGRAIRLIGG